MFIYLGNGNAVAVRNSLAFDSVFPVFLDDVVCQGTELNLLQCLSNRRRNCLASGSAGVICDGKIVSTIEELS